jgi:hypothetical protein
LRHNKVYRGFTLQWLATTSVIISIACTLLISVTIGYQSNKSSLRDSHLDMNRINAQKMANVTDDLLSSAKGSLEVSAQFLRRDMSRETLQLQLDLLKESNHNFNSIFVSNAKGTVLGSSPNTLGIEGIQLQSEGSKQALAEKKALISDPYIGATGRLIVLISHPIFNDNNLYLGFVGGTIYLHEPNIFGTMLGTHIHSDTNSYNYVVSNRGEILYHPDKGRIGDSVMANVVVARVLRGDKGSMRL